MPGAPTVVDVDHDAGVTTMTLVPGTLLSEAPVPPECHHDVYRQIGALLRAVHDLAQPGTGT